MRRKNNDNKNQHNTKTTTGERHGEGHKVEEQTNKKDKAPDEEKRQKKHAENTENTGGTQQNTKS